MAMQKAQQRKDYLFPNEISHKRSFKEDYDITDNLGSGAFGVVRKARSKQDTNLYVAIKTINKADCKPEELFAEVKLLRLLAGSKGIVHMYDVYESIEKVNIVMELISGGELFDAILENVNYSELEASKLAKQIACIVEYLHGKNIVHRDLKPENLLFSDKQNNILKLIDFGIATIVEDKKKLVEVVGSRSYMAPEIHMRTGYHKPVDTYAIGVIIYILLCGYPPFDFDQGIYELAFNSPEWDPISDTVKELISNLLQDDQTKRYTASALVKHPWLKGIGTSTTPLGQGLKGTIKNFRDYNNLVQQMAGNYKQTEGRGTLRGKPTGTETSDKAQPGVPEPVASTANQRRMSIFGAFNIVKETKELEAAQSNSKPVVDFEPDQKSDKKSQKPSSSSSHKPSSSSSQLGGQRVNNNDSKNPSPKQPSKPEEKKPKDAFIGQNKSAENNNNNNNNNKSKEPEKKEPTTAQEKEIESINNLKNDLRQHGKAFNKLKQDLIAYSRTTENDLLRRQLLKSAEEINVLTNSYKSTFDTIIPVLNKASMVAGTGTQ